mgnify:CR=1 FL=1
MTKDEIFNLVKKNILEVLPDIDESIIVPEKHLRDLGANSVDRMEIITMTMEDLNINIPLLEFGKVKNMDELCSVLLNEKVK